MKTLKIVGTTIAAFVIMGFVSGCDTPNGRAVAQGVGSVAGSFFVGMANAMTAQYSYDEYGNVVVTQAPMYVESDNDGFLVEDDGDYLIVNVWYGGEFVHRRITRTEYTNYHQRFANARGQHRLAGPRQQRSAYQQQHINRGTPTGRVASQGQFQRSNPGFAQVGGGGQHFQQQNSNGGGGNQKSSGGKGKKDKKN